MAAKATRFKGAALFLGLWGGVVGADSAWATGIGLDTGTPVSTTNVLTREEEESGWKLLFNGKDLSGWRVRDSAAMPTGWKVADTSMAYGGRGPTSILSTEEYGDFELTMDWKVGFGADAGVYFRVWNEKDVPSHVAPEAQLTDNLLNPQAMEPKRSAGACTHLYAPTRDATLPTGQFNSLRVVAVGTRIEHWINGSKVVVYDIGNDDWKSRLARSPLSAYPDLGSGARGYIGLQQSSTSVRFRNIKIRSLGMAIAILPSKAAVGAHPRKGARQQGGMMISEFWGIRDVKGRTMRFMVAGK